MVCDPAGDRGDALHPQAKNLPEVTLPDSIRYTADLEEAMKEKDMLVLSVPSVFVRSTARRMKEFCPQGQIIVDVAKGIEEDTLKTMTEIIQEEIPQCEPAGPFGPQPRGGGEPRPSHHLCGRLQEEKDRGRPSSPPL